MKKDLARLRELDSVREREKISNLKPNSQHLPKDIEDVLAQKPAIAQAVKVPATPSAPKQNLPKPAPEKMVPKDNLEEILNQTVLKAHASEAEKQQIFLLESQKVTLQKELQSAGSKTDPAVALEKNALDLEKKHLQEKLASTTKEKEATVDQAQKENLEKEIWSLQTNLKKAEEKSEVFTRQHGQEGQKQENLALEIKTTDDKLKNIYSGIKERDEKKAADALSKAQAPKEPAIKKPEVKKILVPEKPFLEKASPLLKKTLETSAGTEEAERRKFIEDVEKWANEHKEINLNKHA